MYRILIIIFILACCLPNESYSQKRYRRHKSAERTQVSSSVNNQEVTNLFIDATKARLTKDMVTAERLYSQCLEKNPDHAPSLYELAQIFADKNDYSTATKYARRASEIEPENKWYKLLLVEIYGKSGQNAELLKECQILAEEDPENVEYLYELANAYLVNNNGSNAIKTYDKLEQLLGINEDISLQKYKIYLYQKKTDAAVREIANLIQAFPEQETHYNSMIAEMYMQANKPDKAMEYYRRIQEKDPGNPYIHITLSDYYRQKGDTLKAFEELKKGFANPALDIDTKMRVLLSYFTVDEMFDKYKAIAYELAEILVKTHPNDPKSHSLYGDFLFGDKKYKEAIIAYKQVLAVDSSRYAVWESLMTSEMQISDFNSLEKETARAIELFPLQPIPYLYRGAVFLEKKKYEDAVTQFNLGVKQVVSNNLLLNQFYIYLGDAYNGMKNYKLSDENFERALKIDPENSFLLNNYAYYLSLRNENLAKAETMALKAVEKDPKNSANLDTYGWVLFKQGKYEEALKWVEKALLESPKEDPDLLEHYGDILYKLGDTEKAVTQWQKALKLEPGSELLGKKVKERKLYE